MGDVSEVWEILSKISIGTIVGWIIVAGTIITGFCAGAIKLYKIFEKTHNLCQENDEFKSLVQNHTDQLNNLKTMLDKIQKSLDVQKEVNLKQLRHELVRSCEIALANGKITTSALSSLEEMYEEYINIYHANGYVKTLMTKVRKLSVESSFEE